MPFLKRTTEDANQLEKADSPTQQPLASDGQKITFLACFLGLVASIGGFMFGYVSGQISGFFGMEDYAQRFGQCNASGVCTFDAPRQGTIVGLLCIGCLFGSLIAGNLADTLGRRLAISVSALSTSVGTIIEISSQDSWVQFAIGRLVTGLGIGALSVAVPMYQSESSPAIIRGVLVSTYQLFITLGIWTAEMVNFGTEKMDSSASWRIPNGLSFLWALILGGGILLLPESPRFAYRQGREDEARRTIARLAGIDPNSRSVNSQISEIRAKLDEERAGADTKIWQIFSPKDRMLYRTMLGIVLQAGQQLTGANFFFYYGTTVFAATGLKNSYVTQIILGTVNVVCTFGGLVVVQKCGRRNALMVGAAWMMMCFFVYAFVGHYMTDPATGNPNQVAGNVLIVFSCLFIVAFATTWGPLVWAVVAELYPARYRAPCMAVATASNWFWNFMQSFFTRFIVDAIDWFYGLVFACCCAALVLIVFFFVIESKDRSLEEIDTMYLLHVNPITSAKWDGSKLSPSAETSGRNSLDEESQAVHRVPTKTIHE
ncbi:general substrate transporter [Polychaeton citri CBS 116435]|uniref:General substrate transporter n=1 Tax=Polychaeton citri CBS 116435 TaxID=1314669 RepID=A0A9P4QEY9_9PEZI|nr:general substrate transporter [Polychaeton citri CBS 116435]